MTKVGRPLMGTANRWAVFGLFFFSGGCALIYQITWMRLFRLVMGNTVFTSATVLTAFMAGLALGSFIAGRLTDRSSHPLRAYAWLEVLIGLCGFGMVPASLVHAVGVVVCAIKIP